MKRRNSKTYNKKEKPQLNSHLPIKMAPSRVCTLTCSHQHNYNGETMALAQCAKHGWALHPPPVVLEEGHHWLGEKTTNGA